MAVSAYRALADRVPLSYVQRELGEEAADAWLEGEPARVVRDGGSTVVFEKDRPGGEKTVLEVPKAMLRAGEP